MTANSKWIPLTNWLSIQWYVSGQHRDTQWVQWILKSIWIKYPWSQTYCLGRISWYQCWWWTLSFWAWAGQTWKSTRETYIGCHATNSSTGACGAIGTFWFPRAKRWNGSILAITVQPSNRVSPSYTGATSARKLCTGFSTSNTKQTSPSDTCWW